MDTVNNMSQETLDSVCAAIPLINIQKYRDKDIAMLLRIMYWCALRPREALPLKAEQFNLDLRVISLGKTKTRKNDTAVIPKTFIPELTTWLSNKSGDLFPNLKYHTFASWLRKLGQECNVKGWQTPQHKTGEKTLGHLFRKSMGKHMLAGEHGEKAKNMATISKHLRHSKPSMTWDYYLKADAEQVKESL